MKISIQLFVTPRKAITIESGPRQTTGECMEDIEKAIHNLKLQQVKKDLICLFGAD